MNSDTSPGDLVVLKSVEFSPMGPWTAPWPAIITRHWWGWPPLSGTDITARSELMVGTFAFVVAVPSVPFKNPNREHGDGLLYVITPTSAGWTLDRFVSD